MDSCSLIPRLTLIGMALLGCLGCNETPTHPMPDLNPTVASPVKEIENQTHTGTALQFREAFNSGLEFTFYNGEDANLYTMIESLGGGIALIDIDGDHDLDVFIPGGGLLPKLEVIAPLASGVFLNDGSFKFRNVSESAGVSSKIQYSHGGNVGDYNNDGFSDVLVTGHGQVVLWMNCGDGTFFNVTHASALTDPDWGTSSAWGDFNNDGNLDLYICHYGNWSWKNNPRCEHGVAGRREICPPRRFEGVTDLLFVSNGLGEFRESGSEFGLKPGGKGLGVVAGDLDGDADTDLYVANDTEANFLYFNSGNHFDEVGVVSGAGLSDRGTPDGSMGVDMDDITADGRADLWVANYESESFGLYMSLDNRFFQHVSRPMGVTAVGGLFVGWGTNVADFDNDRDLDIFCSNGHVLRHPINVKRPHRPLLFDNQNGKKVIDVARDAGDYLRSEHHGRGSAVGDLNGDGSLDLVISRVNQPVAVLVNEQSTQNRHLFVRLIGTRSNRDATGATVKVFMKENSQPLVRLAKSGGSYASSNDRRLHFGLGSSGAVDRIEVQWPSGASTVSRDPELNSTVSLIEGF